jgi:hypothetical protein
MRPVTHLFLHQGVLLFVLGQADGISTIPWLQLGVGGGLAVLQAYMLWRLIFDVQPKSEARWQAAFTGLEKKIEDLVTGSDKASDSLFTRLELMDKERRAEAKEVVADHRKEMAEKRHEFLNALQSLQKQWLEVWKDVRQLQAGKLPEPPNV